MLDIFMIVRNGLRGLSGNMWDRKQQLQDNYFFSYNIYSYHGVTELWTPSVRWHHKIRTNKEAID